MKSAKYVWQEEEITDRRSLWASGLNSGGEERDSLR